MKKFISYLLYILLLSNVGFAQTDFKVIGYAQTEGLLNISDNEWARITHLDVAFINADANGEIVTGPYAGKGQFGLSDVDLKAIVKKAHQSDVKVIISLAGGAFWGDLTMRDRYHQLMTKEFRGPFIHNLSRFLTENELDGIDIDIEGDAISKDLGPFICDLSVECKKNNWELSAAWGGRSAWADSVQDDAVACLDYLSIMSYDATGSWAPDAPGPHASYDKAVDDIEYWHNDRGVAYEKLVLGLPFYGKNFGGANPGGGVLFSEIALKKENINKDQDGLIYYNGKPTIQKKTELALNHNLGGVMIWEILGDASGDLSLLGAIQKTLIDENTYTAISGFSLKDKALTSKGDLALTEIQSIRIFNELGTLIKFLPKKKLKIKDNAIAMKANLTNEYYVLLTINGEKRLLVQ